MADPFREHRFSAKDVRRIVRLTADLAERDPGTAAVERTLTRDELERAAGELGLPASAVTRAIEHAGHDERGATRDTARSMFLGAPTRLTLEKEVEGEPGEDEREDVLDDIREAMGETGAIESRGKTLIWRLDPGYRGAGRDVAVRLRSRDGRTRIVVEERLGRLATGLFVGLGVGGGVGPTGAYVAAIVKLGAMGLVFPLLWVPLMLLLARSIFVAIVARRRRTLEKVMRRLEEHAASWSNAGAPARARVAAVTGARVAAAVDADLEWEAEAEAGEAAAEPRARR